LDVSGISELHEIEAISHIEVPFESRVGSKDRNKEWCSFPRMKVCARGPVLLQAIWGDMQHAHAGGTGERPNAAEAVLEAQAVRFAAWVAARPEPVVWVTTHQGPMRRQLEAFLGPAHVAQHGYRSPTNAQAVALFLPGGHVACAAPPAPAAESAGP
jgi:hypothetical protein